MPEQRIYGHSDDVFCLEGQIEDEVCCFDRPVIMGLFSSTTNEQITVYGEYASPGTIGGVWTIGIAPADEDVPIPDWNFCYTSHPNGYSPMLVMDVPADVKMKIVSQDNERE